MADPRRFITILLLGAALALAGCSGSDETAGTGDTTAEAEDVAADAGGDDQAAAGSIDPALFDPEATCGAIDGLEIEGVGTAMQQSASTNSETNVACLYSLGEGLGFRFTLNGSGSTADQQILQGFIDSGEAEEVPGIGATAVQQETQLRAYFDGGLLMDVAVTTGETNDVGATIADPAATQAAAQAVVAELGL